MCYSLDKSRQRGTVMLISMIILLVMSLIILQGARSSNLELLIGSNSEYATEALAQAEDSVESGEVRIETWFDGAPVDNYGQDPNDGIYLVGQIDIHSVDWTDLNYSYDGGYTETSGGESVDVAKFNLHVIEYLGPAPAAGGSLSVGAGVASDTRYIYRISGLGESTRGGARVIQTIYATAE